MNFRNKLELTPCETGFRQFSEGQALDNLRSVGFVVSEKAKLKLQKVFFLRDSV